MNLVVKLAEGGNGNEHIEVPEGTEPGDYLNAFLRRESPFDGDWVALTSGEWVRYSYIVRVRLPRKHAGGPIGVPKH
jgi:hypothetical protein